MARIRSVHPGLFTDEAFASLSADAQVLLIGLWTEADDQGVFEWKPITIRMRLRPTKDGAIDPLLSELEAANCIRHVEIGGRQLGAIRNFRKYQRPKSPKEVHIIDAETRNYVGLSRAISESDHVEPPPIPPNGEKCPQRKEEGGRSSSEAKASGADAPAEVVEPELPAFLDRRSGPANGTDDPIKALFDLGVSVLASGGTGDKQARSLVGKWRKELGDDTKLVGLFMAARKESTVEPVAWLTKAVAGELSRKRFGSGYIPPGVGG